MLLVVQRCKSAEVSVSKKIISKIKLGLVLLLGIEKKDKVLVILPRVPEWYSVLFGCAKMGAVAMPGTTLLTAKDIEYRVLTSKAKAIVVSKLHSDAVEQINHFHIFQKIIFHYLELFEGPHSELQQLKENSEKYH